MKKLVSLLLLLSFDNISAHELEPENNKVLKIGNFALPTSQQLGPLIGFGQNINDKGDFLGLTFIDFYKSRNAHCVDILPSILYSFSDHFSIFVNFPVAASYKNGCDKSSGIEDIFAQLEYCFYNEEKRTFINQATIVGKITFPTGSTSKNPATGFGTPGFFLGGTFNHLAIDWYYFFSCGGLFTLKHDNKKHFGNQLLYQCGFGKNIGNPGGGILTWVIEFDGYYTQQDTCNNIKDKNTGSNVIYLTPSIWYSTKRIVAQFGIGIPFIQHLFGEQPKEYVLIAANFAWKFH